MVLQESGHTMIHNLLWIWIMVPWYSCMKNHFTQEKNIWTEKFRFCIVIVFDSKIMTLRSLSDNKSLNKILSKITFVHTTTNLRDSSKGSSYKVALVYKTTYTAQLYLLMLELPTMTSFLATGRISKIDSIFIPSL